MIKIIKNDKIRSHITLDLAELEICYKNNCYKSVVILSCGIIESILYDIVSNTSRLKSKIENFEKRNIGLEELIKLSKSENLLNENTILIINKIREYRNTIHPNSYIRTDLSISENIAEIANACVKEIFKNLAKIQENELEKDSDYIIKNFFKSEFNRLPTESELTIFSPIIGKYNKEKGLLIIARSINFINAKRK
ncbi:hypothetical protein [Leptospira kanakyensis]|uniref:hypothetical protein n=1 Tax=Leptospira kanakyensis TaxID=2484968 RepID=UPI00223E6FE6|nr:hypothetical protein [Leptospira kanakyensis]MCW7471739.1 hypothetical protein [Leptospira kanakyensis]